MTSPSPAQPTHSQREQHWQGIYQSKPEAGLSWHQAAPTLSLELIGRFARPGSSVLDVGGGASPLAGALVQEGFSPCWVLDISAAALAVAKQRLPAEVRVRIEWRVADVLDDPQLPSFDVWHDRAVFHFMTTDEQRAVYIRVAEKTVSPGGLLIVGTFALEGPATCSGLPVQRYDAPALAAQFAASFKLRHEAHELHTTPAGKPQPFVYVVLERS